MSQIIRNRLLQLLLEQNESFLSGEEMSKRLGCSRAAIWKHIQELRNQGYIIEARSRNGYRLQWQPDRVAPEEIDFYLTTKKLGREVKYFPSLSTTQEIAHEWAQMGAPEGAVVIADQQVSGRGRLGTHWISPPGTGVWMSLILRPLTLLQMASHFTLLAAVAVYEAVQQFLSIPLEIKWPNDLLIEGKKVCGIITELRGEQDRIDYMVLGMGLNVKEHEELPVGATSLEQAVGHGLVRAQVIGIILQHIEECYRQYLQYGFGPIRRRWEAGAKTFFGREIQAKTWQGMITGIAEGLNEHGALIVRSGTKQEVLYSAEIQMKE